MNGVQDLVRGQRQEIGEAVSRRDLGEEGDATFPLAVPNAAKVNNTIQVLFPCEEINLFDIVDPGVFVALDNLTVLGLDNSPLRKYGAAFVEDQSFFGNWMTNAAVVLARPEDRVKMFMSSGPRGVKYLLTNTPESWLDDPPESISDEAMAQAQGRGFMADQGLILYPFYQSALDLWSLNRARLMKLEDHGVTNARAAELHEESTRALRAAREALESRRYDAFAARSREAWGFEARAYPDVRYAADDTVDGIVFYFMLLVPFCFFLERLFFGFTDIRKRLASVGVIFAAVFMLLQNVHPAFQLSLTPYMVFLAFIILAMALIIITTIVTRFDTDEAVERVGDAACQITQSPCAVNIIEDATMIALPNVWLGVSAEDQRTAEERIPPLLETPAALRWLSAEPLLGPLEIDHHLAGMDALGVLPRRLPALDWVVVGGESGPGARPMEAAWARSLRNQCICAETAFFFKQWGGRSAKSGGRELDGRTWDEMPPGSIARA